MHGSVVVLNQPAITAAATFAASPQLNRCALAMASLDCIDKVSPA